MTTTTTASPTPPASRPGRVRKGVGHLFRLTVAVLSAVAVLALYYVVLTRGGSL
ncbi:hypothetical protein GT045_11125 [Streptomyces sp. SID486]|uniref:hypothetical protein n=1 Tax=unclassified Streptomyces TaxID=2593676 RepID=UPI00136C2568|nr:MULTISPECIES: hypothetical protein [unclassified Streptomyces]MYW20722.1 hypothetical protein [Streptomyces sp. SID2955]MYW49657.1 hypothetical protein [Streptomyces sp. SID161]MYX95348.1 hypothetical protein [Streptomyces sp. SID486]